MRKVMFSVFYRGLIPVVLVSLTAIAQAQVLEECGVLENAYGPFDYRTAEREAKVLVEERHFPAVVETLTAGSTGSLAADIDYTLRVFPNHPRALMAMTRLAEREKAG